MTAAAALSDECPLAKAADIECCKGGSELSLKSVDGQDGTEECAITVNDDYFDDLVIGTTPTSLTRDLTNVSVIDVMAEQTSIKLKQYY